MYEYEKLADDAINCESQETVKRGVERRENAEAPYPGHDAGDTTRRVGARGLCADGDEAEEDKCEDVSEDHRVESEVNLNTASLILYLSFDPPIQ